MRHDSDRVIQRHTLRERGITLAGPDPQTLIDPISQNELRRAMLAIMWWLMEILDDRVKITRRGYQSYIVLTMCRILYTLEYGAIASKAIAARWAQQTLGERWGPLIERALVGRQHPEEEIPLDDLSRTMEFIRHTLERSRQLEIQGNHTEENQPEG